MSKLRNLIVLGALSALFLIPSLSTAKTRVYIRFGPPPLKAVRVIKPPRPYRGAVWVSGHWAFRKGRYVWVNGYYVKARPGHVYVRGHWKKTPRGYYYVPGHWARR
ncbi:MAG: YXWGXW repeat-containing protein [bacterium]